MFVCLWTICIKGAWGHIRSRVARIYTVKSMSDGVLYAFQSLPEQKGKSEMGCLCASVVSGWCENIQRRHHMAVDFVWLEKIATECGRWFFSKEQYESLHVCSRK